MWRSWLRHCATNRKVAGLIPDGIIWMFHWHNPSGRTMALVLTQPLKEMTTRNISWGVKAAGAYGWQPYHLRVPIVLKFGSPSLLEPSGLVQVCNGIALPLTMEQSPPSGKHSYSANHFPSFYRTRRFVTVFTKKPRFVSILSQINRVHSHSIYVRLILMLSPSMPRSSKWPFQVFFTRIQYAFLFSPLRTVPRDRHMSSSLFWSP